MPTSLPMHDPAPVNLIEQARRRVELARGMGREPLRWVATDDAAAVLGGEEQLHGLPLGRGRPRSDWGLDLVLADRLPQ